MLRLANVVSYEMPVQDMIAEGAGFETSLAGCKRYP
jgi:hypothetical protein